MSTLRQECVPNGSRMPLRPRAHRMPPAMEGQGVTDVRHLEPLAAQGQGAPGLGVRSVGRGARPGVDGLTRR
jgi:hypothetical protein